jgi:hypothetical protein
MNLPAPFAYPSKPHVRRHGPQGYSKYGQYRNWLRDEFSFRCVYCLRRETWGTLPRDFEIDHFVPVSKREDLKLDYDNLGYACAECNGTKAAQIIPRPEAIAYGDCLHVDENGEIHARNAHGKTVIEALDLSASEYNAMRRLILDAISENQPGSKTLKWCLGYPDDLPNLSAEKKPKDNKRLSGIRESHYEQKQRDELPEYY